MHLTLAHPVPRAAVALLRNWGSRLLPARHARRLPQADQPLTWTDADWCALRGLSAQTLRDIGVPEWVQERRSAADRSAWDLLRR